MMLTPSYPECCVVCYGELGETTITHDERRHTHLYLFQNVPAKICTACGTHIATLSHKGPDERWRSPGSSATQSMYDTTRCLKMKLC